MKFYEEMNPIDRKIMLLNMAEQSVRLEGMDQSADQLIEEIREWKQKKVQAIIQQPDPQKGE